MTKRLSKADILERAATKTKDIIVPEWAVGKEKQPPTVTIKAWSIADRDEILNELRSRLNGVKVSTLAPRVCAVSLVDPDTGELMFGSEEGVQELRGMAHEGLVRVADAAYHFNGLGIFATDDEGAALRKKAEEEAVGVKAEEETDNPN